MSTNPGPWPTHPDEEGEELVPRRGEIMKMLVEKGIVELVITFDGSGDSGQIEQIEAESSLHPEVKLEDMLVGNEAAAYYDVTTGKLMSRPKNVRDELEEWAYGVLEMTGVDWVNNDGGYGTIRIHTGDNTITVDMNARYTSVNETTHEF
jgi:hypothetical protein